MNKNICIKNGQRQNLLDFFKITKMYYSEIMNNKKRFD